MKLIAFYYRALICEVGILLSLLVRLTILVGRKSAMKTDLRVARRTMGDIYRLIIANGDLFNDFPMQIVVVDEMPIIPDADFQEDHVVCITEPKGRSGICFIRKNGNESNVVLNLLEKKICIRPRLVKSISDYIDLDIDTQITPRRLIEAYKHTIIISKMLQLETPLMLLIKDPTRRAFRMTYFDNNNQPIADIIYVTLQGLPRMIHSIAHELRHCWQEYRGENYYINYSEYSSDQQDKFLTQKEEIDADAFGCLYLNALGYDGLSMAFENNDEYKDPFWKDYIALLQARTEEIKTEERILFSNLENALL